MDGERVSGEPSEEQPQKSYTQIFRECLPYYLSIGMSAREFWHGDVTLVISYREADKLRAERRNYEMWLQGMYIYEAVCDASPIFNPYAKRNTRPRPYPSEPYSMKPAKKTEDDSEARKKMEKARRAMDTFATKINGRLRQKQEVKAPDGR